MKSKADIVCVHETRLMVSGQRAMAALARSQGWRAYLCVFHSLCDWVPGGEGVKQDWYTACLCSFSTHTAQESKFPKLISLML